MWENAGSTSVLDGPGCGSSSWRFDLDGPGCGSLGLRFGLDGPGSDSYDCRDGPATGSNKVRFGTFYKEFRINILCIDRLVFMVQ